MNISERILIRKAKNNLVDFKKTGNESSYKTAFEILENLLSDPQGPEQLKASTREQEPELEKLKTELIVNEDEPFEFECFRFLERTKDFFKNKNQKKNKSRER